jgi:putative hydrolase
MTDPNPGVLDELRRIAYLLERKLAPSYRVEAFRRAERSLQEQDIASLASRGELRKVKGVGERIEGIVREVLRQGYSDYRVKLEEELGPQAVDSLRAALKGDLHVHTIASDGGATMLEMVETAIALGHEYVAITDHSQSLKIARGLSIERVEEQFQLVEQVQAEVGGRIRVLIGSECDILPDGSLDYPDEVLERLDIVVGSVHSKLRIPADEMTERLLTVMQNPYLDVLGHPTGRMSGAPRSHYDHALVFAAAAHFGVALEINSRPERLDLQPDLVELAASLGCDFAINTDAHAQGQLDWQGYGTAIAQAAGLPPERVINTRDADDLLESRGRPDHR